MSKRRFKAANIKYISLVPRGANRLPVIYKAEDQSVDFDTLIKASDNFDDNGELTAVVYAPEVRDAHGDIASAAVIKDMMYNAAKNGVNIDVRHNELALKKDAAYIAESFLIQKGDERFNGMKDYDGNVVDVSGAWAVVVKIEDTVLRKQYKQGAWNGVSMGGTGTLEIEKGNESIAAEVVAILTEQLGINKKDDINMDKKELLELLKENNVEVAKATQKSIEDAVAKALKPAEKTTTEADKALEAPVFKGDRSNLEDIKKHKQALAQFNLAKGVDWTNPDSIEKYEKKLEELQKTEEKANGQQEAPKDSDEVKRLKKELSEAEKRSNVAAGVKTKKSEDAEGDENNNDDEGFALGSKIAKGFQKK